METWSWAHSNSKQFWADYAVEPINRLHLIMVVQNIARKMSRLLRLSQLSGFIILFFLLFWQSKPSAPNLRNYFWKFYSNFNGLVLMSLAAFLEFKIMCWDCENCTCTKFNILNAFLPAFSKVLFPIHLDKTNQYSKGCTKYLSF